MFVNWNQTIIKKLLVKFNQNKSLSLKFKKQRK
jgi:hypothetical protein